jgi:hypothetical protein
MIELENHHFVAIIVIDLVKQIVNDCGWKSDEGQNII